MSELPLQPPAGFPSNSNHQSPALLQVEELLWATTVEELDRF
jgi:hypothetical protein